MSLVVMFFAIEAFGFFMAVCYRHPSTTRVEVTLGTTIISASLGSLALAGWVMSGQLPFINLTGLVWIVAINLVLTAFVVVNIITRKGINGLA